MNTQPIYNCMFKMSKLGTADAELALQACGWENTAEYLKDVKNGYVRGVITSEELMSLYVTNASNSEIEVDDYVRDLIDLTGFEKQTIKGVSNIATNFYVEEITAYTIDGALWVTEEDYVMKFC